MAFYLYRVNGGEVLGMSVNGYPSIPSDLAQVENPTAPDGATLAPKKIFSGGALRNATAEEIAGFPALEAADEMAKTKTTVKLFLDDGDRRNLLSRAIAELIVDELNIIRGWTVSFKAEVAAATTLADLKTRVATLSSLSDRTKAQVLTAIKNKVDALS